MGGGEHRRAGHEHHKPLLQDHPEPFSGKPEETGRASAGGSRCFACGGGNRWIKTCRAGDGSRVRLCDACWEALRLVIVPGDEVVAARCDGCGRYANPREFAVLHAGGRKDAYGGVCAECAVGGR